MTDGQATPVMVGERVATRQGNAVTADEPAMNLGSTFHVPAIDQPWTSPQKRRPLLALPAEPTGACGGSSIRRSRDDPYGPSSPIQAVRSVGSLTRIRIAPSSVSVIDKGTPMARSRLTSS